MQITRFLILAAIVCTALTVAGCTTTTTPAAPATPAPATTLASLALTPAEVPPGYVLTESREKNATELSSLAMDLGWQAGYVVKYTNSSAASGSRDVILHTITTYPKSSMPDIITYVSMADRSYGDITYTDLKMEGMGRNGGGFVGRVKPGSQPVAMIIIPTTESPLSAGERLVPASSPVNYGQDLAEVYFSKGTTFEVIRMSGPHASGEEVLNLAGTAYAKIP